MIRSEKEHWHGSILIVVATATTWLLLLGASLEPPPASAQAPSDDLTLTPVAYLPFVCKPFTCPETSTRTYRSGVAYQYDTDDPVRPAYNHADKNIELRGYSLNPAPGVLADLYDYDQDDPKAPQFARLFEPHRVPAFDNLYRVHDWYWADSPDPGTRGAPLTDYPVTALGMRTTPSEVLHVPDSGYSIGGDPPMEVLVIFADEDTVALRYTREDSSAPRGYTLHIDNICTDPKLLALYNKLDNPNGPRYEYPNPEYQLPNLPAGKPFGVARGTETILAISDTGGFQDPRSCRDWWQVRPGYSDDCSPLE
jgi:hypothetical protein